MRIAVGLYKRNTLADRFTTLETIINKAIQAQLLHKDYNPFKDFKSPKKTATQKRAISKEDVKKIEQLSVAPERALSHNIRTLSYSK